MQGGEMPAWRAVARREQQVSVEVLTDEALKLLRIEIDELYVTLGTQLLSQSAPTRAAEVVGHLAAVARRSEPLRSVAEWEEKQFGAVYNGLREDGIRFVAEIREDLRAALCNEDILLLSDQPKRFAVQIVVVIVGAILRMPVELEPISVTVAAILFKIGLRNFCN